MLLKIIISVSGVCLGIKVASGPDMIFNGVSNFVEKRIGKYWSKPIFGCPACMSSFWGSIVYWSIVRSISIDFFVYWPIVCLTCVVLNSVLWTAYLLYMERNDS